jgi:protease-4
VLIILQFVPVLIKGIITQYRSYISPRTVVGVIPIKGTIYSAHPITKNVREFFKNEDIKAIVLKIDCCGGAAGSCENIFNEIIALKNEYPKPVIALIENTCASGGYWISCAADHIIAPRSAVIGSIGAAFGNLFQLRDLAERHGVGYESITAGSHKAATDPFVPMTPENKVMLQRILDDTYRTFTTSVAERRHLSLEDVKSWADAQLFTGAQAHALGLIDEIGSAHTATTVIKERAMIEGEIEWRYPQPSQSFIQRIFQSSYEDGEESPELSAHIMNRIASFLEQRYSHKTIM